MKQWKLNNAGSVVYEDYQIDVVEGKESIMQSIRLGLYCWKGSKFDDPNFGMDWGKILRNPDGIPIDDLLTIEINAFFVSGFDPRIRKLTFMSVELDGRYVKINGNVATSLGNNFTVNEVLKIR